MMNQIIRKIVIVVGIDNYDNDTFKLRIDDKLYVLIKINDEHNFNNYDEHQTIYCAYCDIVFTGYLIFRSDMEPTIRTIGSVNNPCDADYNHCLDVCDNQIILPAPGERTYSTNLILCRVVDGKCTMYRGAITFYAS